MLNMIIRCTDFRVSRKSNSVLVRFPKWRFPPRVHEQGPVEPVWTNERTRKEE